MDDKTELWNLYKQLKEEIIQSDTRNNLLLTIIISATGAILSLGFSQKGIERPWIILCGYVFLIPIYGILYGNRRNIWRISTYLRVFIEPKLKEIKWELRLDKLGKIEKMECKQLTSGIITNEFKLVTALSLIILIALFVSFVHQILYLSKIESFTFNFEFWNSLVSLLLGVILFSVFYKKSKKSEKDLRRTGQIEKCFYESWETIKHEEQN